jgi:predicted Ser/Thr protein kinase
VLRTFFCNRFEWKNRAVFFRPLFPPFSSFLPLSVKPIYRIKFRHLNGLRAKTLHIHIQKSSFSLFAIIPVTFFGIRLGGGCMNESEENQNMGKKCPQCGATLPSGVLEGLCPACLFKQGAAADTAVPPETAPFQPPGVEEVARLFPQLEILAFIGKGGMGAVYKARQPALDRVVALKILPPQTAAGTGFVERFNREARALAKLNHPNIVAVYEFGQVNGLPFFIMEFVDGLNLRQLERAGKLSPREALQIVPQICEALQFAHDEGIVHRDIKPENILLDKKGRVKIADFGIAKILGREADPDLTQTKGAIGTPHYMAPEQVEKPASVDHRADIFSLGVVFYEMLTGELPLGKFAPPSSRKVEVDVRLDDVVLRALEKDPERRYQHVSQVKTAVDTIAGTPDASPPPAADAGTFAQEILARGYNLDVGSCLRRAWALLRKDFWPLVGITALLMALLSIAGAFGGSLRHSSEITSVVAIIVWGPLMGGLYLFFLKKIRGEPATVETAFSGFGNRFLHLFLAGFVTSLLTWLGFLCLVLPGIYLMVAWIFALPLVIDKGLDFWPAMELSRKIVTKHWWKFLGFEIVLLLLSFAGFLACVVGLFIMAPVALAALMYAYEDIFGVATQTATSPSPKVGPSGTAVLPDNAKTPPRFGGAGWKPARTGFAVVLALVGLIVLISLLGSARRHRDMALQSPVAAEPAPPAESDTKSLNLVFGPVIERVIQVPTTGSNQFLDLDTQQLLTPPSEITSALATSQPGDDQNRFWLALDIPEDSQRFQYISWLRESGADLMFAGGGKIIGFDAVFPIGHGDSSTNWNDWDVLTPGQLGAAVEVVDWSRRATEARVQGQPAPPPPTSGGVYSSAAQLDSRERGGPIVNLLTRDQSMNWFFKTREGAMGVLQIVSFTDDPGAAKIRYKLLQSADDQADAVPDKARKVSRQTLRDRLEAASMMSNIAAKDKSLATVAKDAAKTGEVEVLKDTLRQISDFTKQNQTAHESVRLLAKRGLKRQAMEIAKDIGDITTRDQALSELAQ